jgi:hypothetical protein
MKSPARQKSCFFCLYGGPSQIDIWDMKTDGRQRSADRTGLTRPASTGQPIVELFG